MRLGYISGMIYKGSLYTTLYDKTRVKFNFGNTYDDSKYTGIFTLWPGFVIDKYPRLHKDDLLDIVEVEIPDDAKIYSDTKNFYKCSKFTVLRKYNWKYEVSYRTNLPKFKEIRSRCYTTSEKYTQEECIPFIGENNHLKVYADSNGNYILKSIRRLPE